MEGVHRALLTHEERTVSTHLLKNPGGPTGVLLGPRVGHQGVKSKRILQGTPKPFITGPSAPGATLTSN